MSIFIAVFSITMIVGIYVGLRGKRKAEMEALGDHEPFVENDERLQGVKSPLDEA